MTPEKLEKEHAFQNFIANFAQFCGTSRSVFVGQLAASITEYELKLAEACIKFVAEAPAYRTHAEIAAALRERSEK